MDYMNKMENQPGAPKSRPGGVAFLIVATVLVTLPVIGHTARWKKIVVEKNLTVKKVADFYGVSVRDLLAVNNMKRSTPLIIGQQLNIPAFLSDRPNRLYTIKKGDTLYSISDSFDVSIPALTRANNLVEYPQLYPGRTVVIPLEDRYHHPVFHPQILTARVSSGWLTKKGVMHVVKPGQTLWSIAKAYKMLARRIARANQLSVKRPVQPNQRIVIPGVSQLRQIPAHVHAHRPIHFVRLRNNQQVTLSLMNQQDEVDEDALRILSTFAGRDGITEPPVLLDERLVRLIQLVADQFSGHTIEIISGYRKVKRFKKKRRKRWKRGGGNESTHALGRALDFRVRGVGRRKVYRFVRQFANVGVGYYPNSAFIHLDVREKKTLWVDESRIGEQPRYAKIVTFLPSGYKKVTRPGRARKSRARPGRRRR